MGKHCFLLLVVSNLLLGCSSPKDVSEANFKKAIEAYIEAKDLKYYFAGGACIEVPGAGKTLNQPPGRYLHQDTMIKAGLFQSEDRAVKNGKQQRTFSLTEEGTRAVTKQRCRKNGKWLDCQDQPNNRFCPLSVKVGEVTYFS